MSGSFHFLYFCPLVKVTKKTKNGMNPTFVISFFSLISDGLGGVPFFLIQYT